MPIIKRALHENIYKTIRDRIVYLEYPVGMLLSEKELCQEFKVSRTPLREAIRKLEDFKLVTVIPRYGTFVSPVDINEVRSVFEVKIRLEGLAGEMAARRITPDQLSAMAALIQEGERLLSGGDQRRLIEIDNCVHGIIYQATQNSILQEVLENLQCRCARLWNSILGSAIPVSEIFSHLKEVYTALEGGDAEKANRAMQNHVRSFIDHIKNHLL